MILSVLYMIQENNFAMTAICKWDHKVGKLIHVTIQNHINQRIKRASCPLRFSDRIYWIDWLMYCNEWLTYFSTLLIIKSMLSLFFTIYCIHSFIHSVNVNLFIHSFTHSVNVAIVNFTAHIQTHTHTKTHRNAHTQAQTDIPSNAVSYATL